MPDRERLRRELQRIDGRSYPAYRDLKGSWKLGPLELVLDHVQGDPFASPSRLRVFVPAVVPAHIAHDPDARAAAEDWMLRRFAAALHGSKRGSGKSGVLHAYQPGPEICERSALRIHRNGTIEARFRAGLPARGRRVLGRQAEHLLTEDIVSAASVLDMGDGLDAHIDSVRDQRELRRALSPHGLVAFIADGSVLPRASGVAQSPLVGAVPFQAPASLAVTLPTSSGPVRGLGIPEGVTVIVGGGFHGKSTVLAALQRGHLDHIPGDGRERVVSLADTVKIRAEDGRSVAGVDISPFLSDLPGGRSTRPFSTDDASGSTSQAASIVEAIEAGARLLLMDEDTSATNLLVRDERMRALVPAEHEPITPLVERVRQLHSELGVSTLLVVGGVADYLAAADVVLAMNAYVLADVSGAARGLLPGDPTTSAPLERAAPRIPSRAALRPGKIRARDERRLQYGDGDLELAAVEQILDARHAATIGEALRLLHDELVDEQRDLPTLLDALDAILDDEGVEALSPRDYPDGELVRPRRHEVAAALNRLRGLVVA